jgi:3-polyprenyl-4-hydroxybenzoate decarboxylase
MNAVWGLGGLAFTKFVFIFDEDVDVQDTAAVLFRLGANCDPGRDALHSRGPVDQVAGRERLLPRLPQTDRDVAGGQIPH